MIGRGVMPSAFIPVPGLPLSSCLGLTANRYPPTASTYPHPNFNAPPSQRLGLPKVFMG
jgi:hypothetical protein